MIVAVLREVDVPCFCLVGSQNCCPVFGTWNNKQPHQTSDGVRTAVASKDDGAKDDGAKEDDGAVHVLST